MRRQFGAFTLILAVALSGASLGSPATAQSGAADSPSTTQVVPPAPSPGRNVSATGRVMPPGRGGPTAERSASESAVAADMAKAQKAAAARDKAWDSKMRRTMGSICSGC